MFRKFLPSLAALVLLAAASKAHAQAAPEWSMNATIIEACSCPMFCQCYFNTKPASHGGAGHEGHTMGGGDHFCKFNNAFRVNTGSYGSVKLDGVKFWVGGDLGDDFSDGEMKWAVLHFDKAVTREQRDAVTAIVPHIYPVKWTSFAVGADGVIDWKHEGDMAHASLDGGKTAEVKLTKFAGMTKDPVVIRNLKYWGAPRNDGFVMMPSDVEAYRAGESAFEFKGTNGFMITFDISSKDVMSKG